MNVLLIDNFDSFTYNIVQYLEKLGATVHVYRNNAISLEAVKQQKPSHIVISPGPGRPERAGISMEIISHFIESRPILGVCLGMQCMAQVFGGSIVLGKNTLHGKASIISHGGRGLFKNISHTFKAVRYHSLVVEESSLPAEFIVTARSEDNEIMGLTHRRYAFMHGLQFHPESILSEHGYQILENFLNIKT